MPMAEKDAPERSQAQQRIQSKEHLLHSEAAETPRDNEPRQELNGETEALGPIDAADPNPCRRA